MIELAPWTEWQIAECSRHYAFMDAFRAWWIKWVLPTKKSVPDPRREGEFITYYEDVYNILTRRSDARDELVKLSTVWSSLSLEQQQPSPEQN